MRIVFLGTPEFAAYTLERLIDEGIDVAAVITMPDKPAGRGHKMLQSAVKQTAVAHGLKLLQPVRLKDPEFVDELRAIDADLFVVIAFRMLPEVVWQMPRLGTFNLHASLLPRYRGAAPINRAVMNGDTETGVTTFFLKHEIDTGDIIAQKRIEILPTDNVGDVHDKLMHLGAELTLQTIRDIEAGTLRRTPQEELLNGEEPTPAPKIFKETCHIDWNRPAVEIHNLVRGLSPYPGAWTSIEPLGDVKIFESRVLASDPPTTPGQIRVTDRQTITVDCKDGVLEVLSLQPQGKRRMPVADLLRGTRTTLSSAH